MSAYLPHMCMDAEIHVHSGNSGEPPDNGQSAVCAQCHKWLSVAFGYCGSLTALQEVWDSVKACVCVIVRLQVFASTCVCRFISVNGACVCVFEAFDDITRPPWKQVVVCSLHTGRCRLVAGLKWIVVNIVSGRTPCSWLSQWKASMWRKHLNESNV